jgi:iron complex transport system permease protein
MFRNPMVSPSLLGVSSGAAFGAALGILLKLSFIGVQGFAFIFGLLVVIIVYVISFLLAKKADMTLTLILTGTVISSLFTSLLSLLKFVADPYDDLPAITFWLMGSLSNVTMNEVKMGSIIIVFGIAVLYSIKWKINILSFGEKEALSLGLDANKMRGIIVFFSTLITAAAVSISGLIGWVGLVIPHLARMLVGPNYKYLFPASVLLGGIYMLAIDDLSRTLFAVEIPLGILTSIIGTPFFIYLLAKGKKGWN